MKKLLLLLLILPSILFAQEQDCSWKPGSTQVCDSIAKRCAETAYIMTQRACGMKTSMYYDSLYCSDGYFIEFDYALRSFYNDLVDTLADFRSYLGLYRGMNKESDTIITLIISSQKLPDKNVAKFPSGNRSIDSLCSKWKFKFIAYQDPSAYQRIVQYICPKMINRSYIYRQLKKIDPQIQVSGYTRPTPYDMIQLSIDENNFDYVTITVCETSACMPPELPCTYIRRTFYAQREWHCRYVKFERGVIPWPNIPEALKEE